MQAVQRRSQGPLVRPGRLARLVPVVPEAARAVQVAQQRRAQAVLVVLWITRPASAEWPREPRESAVPVERRRCRPVLEVLRPVRLAAMPERVAP